MKNPVQDEALPPFMQKQIYQGSYFEIDTIAGVEIIPSDVCGETGKACARVFLEHLKDEPLEDGKVVECQHGWLGRLSDPGCNNYTSWNAYKTEAQASDALDLLINKAGRKGETERGLLSNPERTGP